MRREESDTWLGRLVASRYRLIARLGENEMADLYLARHVLIDRLSAIKVLRPEVGRDPGLRALFLREAKAVNRINHPNILEITDYGETDDTAFLVMEYVAGEPLQRLLGTGPLGWERATRIGLQIALALSRAHEMGVIHRDLNPSNVIVVQQRAADDLVKLTDFGVAKLLGGTGSSGTTTGLLPIKVSPGYVAPELYTLGTVDARSDLFSLGVILYECACGALPFAPDRPAQDQPKPRRISDLTPGVSPLFDLSLERLLAVEPDERPRDGFEVIAMLRDVLSSADAPVEEADPPTVRKRPRMSRRSGPRLMTMPFDRIAPLCSEAWASVRRAAEKEIRPGLRDELRQAADLVGMIERLEALVADDTRALAEAEARARQSHAGHGARLDTLAVERSRALGWAGSFAEQVESVRKERVSGAHSISATDALLWEEAALDRVEERSRDHADELGTAIDELRAEQAREDEALERDQSTLSAKLEGHVAALRALAGEAWMALEALAEPLEVELPLA